jgi:hypothetical protein
MDEKLREDMMACARGSYQRGLLNGYECWSGANLMGKAKDYSFHYAISRRNLLKRLQVVADKHGVDIEDELVLRGKPLRWHRELTVKLPDGRMFIVE